jgi:predicted RNA-binding protein with TRAM domain
MIQTGFESRVKVQQVIENQLPNFILDESPNAAEFLKQYYISQEYQSGPIDIAENLDQYLKLDNLTPEVVIDSTYTTFGLSSTDTIIIVSSTKGFPQNYGLLKIDDEIITYTGLTTNTFTGCIRGFSGITSYHADLNQEELVFSGSKAASHTSESSVQNLSSLFLKEFYKKLKYTLTPGLEDIDFIPDLNVGNFIKEARSFYQAKGTDESFRILFNILYGVTPRVVNLEEFLIKPSSAEFIRREIVIVERISGDPSKLVGQTIKKSTDDITSASVSEVEPFTRNNKQYFKISLFVGYDDFSTIQGNFTITPNTKCLENVSVGSSVITVDSTIGFAEIGTIISGDNTITYTSKSINQFFGCSGIPASGINIASDLRSDEYYYGYEDGDTSKKVKLRLTGILSKFVQVSDNLNISEGDIISVKNIGELIQNPEQNKTYKQIFANSWIYNTRSRYQIKDISNFTLSSPIDKSSLKIGDSVEIVKRDSNDVVSGSTVYISNIITVDNKVTLGNNSGFAPISGVKYDLRRKINTANSSIVPIEFGNNVIFSDIQNLYTDENYAYVASNSLPADKILPSTQYAYKITTNINTASISNGTVGILTDAVGDGTYSTIAFSNSVPFINGDRVYYQPAESPLVGLETGSYYVQIQSADKKQIKLYSSRSFIGGSDYLSFGPANGAHSFTLYSQRSGKIGAQKILKKFPLDTNTKNGTGQLTVPGPTGMLINGVEISNYKSNDKIYYGPLESIEVLNGGSNYDVINPPLIVVSTGIGTTALVQPVISGSIQSVYVDAQDYDINTVVSIRASGGNGSGAVFEPIITKRVREIFFDGRATTNSGGISTTTKQLTFLTNHNLVNGESIIYNSNGNAEIGVGIGTSTLVNNGAYYVKIDNNTTIKLYQSISDYSTGINAIGFSTYNNSGIHKFRTTSNKNTISEIKVINGGTGYTNRKLIVSPTGISTVNHTINFKNHGFNSGDLVTYNYQTSAIGISTLSQYYILKIDDNFFKLCDAGIGGTNTSNYDRKKYIKFSSTGSGYHYFNYPDILVSIQYTSVGFSTTTQSYQTIVATPKVRGNIIDAYLYESGTGYGSTVLNLERNPIISIKTGKEAQLKPIIINGTISSVNIQYGGLEYYSNPDLIVIDPTKTGSGAELRPVITDGKITNVEIINAGIGYSITSSIQVKSAGSNAVFNTNIRSLTVNNNVKFGNELLSETENKLQYSVCGYFDTLRQAFNDTGAKHSTIIGWSYDGNPIYGAYSYSDPKNPSSNPKRLNSGYTLNILNINDRPIGFSSGFFIEDYSYTNSGDLDENNGRFGITPDFPNGVYAYFSTIAVGTLEPQFPYFIGNKYRSNILEENSTLDQSFDFNSSNLLRNTFPYKVSDNYADNDFLIESNTISEQKSIVESVTEGYVNDFNIINSGSNYKINDVLNFDSTNTEGGGLITRVSSIQGKDIVNLNTSVESYANAIFTWNNDREVKITILPNHTLSNNDYVIISGFSTNLSKLNNSYQIGVSSYYSNVLKDIPMSTAGLTTEIYVTQLPSSISVGSSIAIETETLQVLEVFKNLNIVKVKRGSTGVSHTATTQINFIPDSFAISQNIDYFDSKVNNKVYFNPKQSVGVGTTAGITNSIALQLGDSTITRNIPTQGIYIENHPFTNNQGVIFTTNGTNISISTSSTGTTFSLPQNVYVTNKNNNTIGIKTTLNSSEVFFITNGSNSDLYSFETSYSQITGKVERIKSTVSVSTDHGLSAGDIISLNVQPNLSVGIGTSTSVYIKRDTTTGKILINPRTFSSTGINTTTNTITINSHNLNTGDKISYSANVIASGLSTGSYYAYKVDANNIKLSETYIDVNTIPPTTVDITSTGGSNQSISLINSQIQSVKNNNLVFNLSDTSLSGYNFKIYYDQNFNNEFVSTATTTGFTLSGVGTIGVSPNASLTINYDDNLPTKLYYNLEKSGYISTSDTDVTNYSEILFTDSFYNSNYTISGIGSTTFNISLNKVVEKLSYTQSECDTLNYTTSSTSAKGSINKINIISGGTGYKKLPLFTGSNSVEGQDAYIIAKSSTIGNAREVRIINEGFEYSSDKTLQPTAFVSPSITIKNSNTIDSISVNDGGKGYTNAPSIVIVDTDTRKKVDSGILKAILSGSAISSVNIVQQPKGLSETTVQLFATNNTNGISIQKVESSSSGIFTCFITTPVLGFSTNPFNIGDKVFVEGIQNIGVGGSGFNSEEYGYQFFTVSNYTTGTLDKVEINITDLTSNTGIAKTIQDSVGNIIKSTDYPSFEVIQKSSAFIIGENLISNNVERDLIITNYDSSFIKVFGSYQLSVGEVITGKESGNIATIDLIENNYGRFKVDYSIRKNLGWIDDIGKLDYDDQVVPDNDYYQNLSYTVKSPIKYQDLKTPVNSLLHTSGLKNFADTAITSTATSGISSSSNATTIIYDIIEENRVDTIYDFDLVVDIDTVGTSSKFLKLKTKKLTDFIQCKSNVVLQIDNINKKFSNLDGVPSEFLNILQLNSGTSYYNLLIRISSADNSQIQLKELVILNDGSDTFLLEKGTIVNVGTGITHISGEELGSFSIIVDELKNSYLRFIPVDPYNIDYDLKLIDNEFNSSSTGIGTTSVGFVDLTGSNKDLASGITTSIISLDSNKFTSLYVNTQVINTNTNDMNFVELYLTHDGVDTYISEYYFDSEYGTNNYSGNFIGTFGANISSGTISLNYTNNSSNTVTTRSKIVGFGTTAVGEGIYRFKLPGQVDGLERSAIYSSKYSSTVSAASTQVVSLNKTDFNAVKSLVKVSVGSTTALHQIMSVQDSNNIYIQQDAFLSVGSTTGIGTFGGEYSGNNFILKFYPDSSITSQIKISSFNICMYTTLDNVNIPPNLVYGTASESVKINFYNAINGDRINRTKFDLTSDGIPIFAKTFDPSDTSALEKTTGIFTIPNHFFSNTEQLVYTPKSTFLGIGSTAMMISPTNVLPSTVFVIKVDNNKFKLATTKNNAQSGIGVTFTSNGEGNAHQLEMYKKNEKAIITIDNVVQYPLMYTPISYNLSGNGGGISTQSTVFSLSGISTIAPKNILKIDNEYMGVVNVGLGTTNVGPITNNGSISLVEVSRGFVGTSATSHLDSTQVRIYKGSYNIVDNNIFFTEPPRGNPQIERDSSNLVFETSDFTGRVYLRNDYTTNQIYDDISNQFTGIGRTFSLTVGGANTVGLGSTGGNGILFINGIFQTPTTDNNPQNNFKIIENSIAGISSVVFSGITSANTLDIFTSEFDVNQNQTPRGGIIISLGSSTGLGYAPLVGAAVTAVVGAGGSIKSVGLGTTDNLGSGYNGIVSIGVSVYESGHTGTAASIRASVGAGGTLSFNIITGGTGYTNPKIFVSEPSYENLKVTGVSRLGIGSTTDTGVGLLLNVKVGASSTVGIGSTYYEVTGFNISRAGYSFKRGDVFKPVGLVTDSRLGSPLSEFKLTVIDTFTDSFAAWQFGEFDYIDSIKNYQDGVRTRFPLYYNQELLSFEVQENSQVNLANALLIVINGVIQDPGTAYQFDGGTSFVFTTAPKAEDNVAIFFYKGTAGDDTGLFTNINETIKRGDNVQVLKNNSISGTITQDKRTVFDLSFSDKFETNLYSDQGVDTENYKPLSWIKQKVDRKINGEDVYKARDSIESQIYPTAKIIKNFSTTDTQIFVDNTELFDYDSPVQFNALIVSGAADPVSAAVTAIVSAAGTIQSLSITNPGSGYTGSSVTVKIAAPLTVGITTSLPMGVGIGIGKTATANITVSAAGTLTTPITITNPGLGYSVGIPPRVIVPLQDPNYENITNISLVNGFSGSIIGIATTTGSGGNPLALKFNLNAASYIGLQTGYPIYIFDTRIGRGVTSIDSSDTAVVGVGSTFLDNIYYIHQFSYSGTTGIITCNIKSNTSIVGLTSTGSISNPVGKFSWGRLSGFTRSSSPISIGVSGNTIDVGLSTFPTIQRRSNSDQGVGLRGTGALPKLL